MPDLLLEFFSEEIPARMQAKAAEDLRKLVTDKLVAAGLTYDGAKAFATPRRLALTVQGVPVRQPDVKDERKGPKVGAPEQAIAGFLRAAGLKSIDEAKVQADKKGDFYVAVIEKAGKPAIDVIAEIVPEVVKTFPWPKSMRWGSGSLNWVRPLHSIVATFGPETEEPDIVPFKVDGVAVGDTTRGHRFMAPAEIRVKRFDDYVKKLDAAKVVLDPARRAQVILTDAKNLAFAQGFELIEDEGLLAEASGLVEWPVALMGSFDAEFLKIPPEVIRATIRNNQKCFVVRKRSAVSKDEGGLANKFIMVANIEASDGGKAIVAGCERVIRARLSDAKFFYETDLKTKLEDRLPKFAHIVFHEKLGTQAERIARIEKLAAELAPLAKADVLKATRAAKLAKADLQTEVVGEFPEVQGLMGRYYATAQGEDKEVAAAIEDHYKPLGPGDRVPTDPISVAVALADKLDILTGFWAIDEKPTGSKDPYALRRAALGIIQIIRVNNLRLRLRRAMDFAFENLLRTKFETMNVMQKTSDSYRTIGGAHRKLQDGSSREIVSVSLERTSLWFPIEERKRSDLRIEVDKFEKIGVVVQPWSKVAPDLLAFFADRLKVQLREQGARHDLVDAVFALEGQDDLLLIVRRVEALGKFLDTDDGRNLLAGAKRAANILRIEEKKDNKSYTGAPDTKLYTQAEEKELARAIDVAKKDASAAVAKEDFAAAMTAMAKLRPHVDAFFDKVTVNVEDKAVRENRLKLLNEIREATRAVADFSKIEG